MIVLGLDDQQIALEAGASLERAVARVPQKRRKALIFLRSSSALGVFRSESGGEFSQCSQYRWT